MSNVTAETKKLSAILLLADYIGTHVLYLRGGKCLVETESEWTNAHVDVMSELRTAIGGH